MSLGFALTHWVRDDIHLKLFFFFLFSWYSKKKKLLKKKKKLLKIKKKKSQNTQVFLGNMLNV